MLEWTLKESPGFAPYFSNKLGIEISKKTDALRREEVEDLKPKRIFRFVSNCFECLRLGFYDRAEGPIGLFSAAIKSQKLATLEQRLQFLVPFCAEILSKLSDGGVKETLLVQMDEEIEHACRQGVQELETAGEEFFRMKKELQELFRRHGKVDAVLAQGIENLKQKIRTLFTAIER